MSDHTEDRSPRDDHGENTKRRGRSLRSRLPRIGRLPRAAGSLGGSPPGAGGRLLQL
jgi:hypothetical protein